MIVLFSVRIKLAVAARPPSYFPGVVLRNPGRREIDTPPGRSAARAKQFFGNLRAGMAVETTLGQKGMTMKEFTSVCVGSEIVFYADDPERAVRRGHEGVPPERAVMAVAKLQRADTAG